MSETTNYQPGHSVHHIQARKALEKPNEWQKTVITEIGQGIIKVQINNEVSTFSCRDTDRLRTIFESGRVSTGKDGERVAIFAPHNVLIVPCADEGKTFPNNAEIIALVSYIENGAALFSPTTDGAWHLFSIGEI